MWFEEGGLIFCLGLSFWVISHLELPGLPESTVLTCKNDVHWNWLVYKAASHMVPHPVT